MGRHTVLLLLRDEEAVVSDPCELGVVPSVNAFEDRSVTPDGNTIFNVYERVFRVKY